MAKNSKEKVLSFCILDQQLGMAIGAGRPESTRADSYCATH